jgi:hypothetical protein
MKNQAPSSATDYQSEEAASEIGAAAPTDREAFDGSRDVIFVWLV